MKNNVFASGILITALLTCFGQDAHASQARRRFPNVEICNAAEAGDLKTVKTLVNSDKSLVNAPGGGLGETPLHLACEKGHYPVVKFLLQNGAHVNAFDGECLTPLGYAVLNDHGRLARYLMDHWRANIAVLLMDSQSTVLHLAASTGNIRLVRTLVQRGLAVNATNKLGETPLHEAVIRCKNPNKIVSELIKIGANVHARDHKGNTPLLSSVDPAGLRLSEIGNRLCALFDILLSHGANINAVNNRQQTALGLCLEKGHRTAAQFLLERGA